MNRKQTLFQKLFLSASFLSSFFTSEAQFLQTTDASTNAPYTTQSLISDVFLGGGVGVSNVTFSGDPKAVAYFSGGTQSIGIERGILLTTGYAGSNPNVGIGPARNGNFFATNDINSNATDAGLAAIVGANELRDVAVYTITFIPNSDTIRFRYCFASEEYPEFSCTNFNDIFGFFIQGPGYPSPTNIAIIPGTNLPVAINNIHPFNDQHNPNPDPCQPYNSQYYNNNDFLMKQPVYDGITDVFTAMAVVIPCQTYTLKLAIADVHDQYYDSGVFLEAKSFGTSSVRVDVDVPSADGSIAEGCSPAQITFSLANPLNYNYPININTFGSATPGFDYQNLPSNLVIPAGQTQITFPIAAIEDGQNESVEMVAFDVKVDDCHRDTFFLYLRDNPIVAPILRDTASCVGGGTYLLDATLSTPTTQAPSFSNTQDLVIPDNFTTVTSTINVSGVPQTNLGPGSIRSVCVNITHTNDEDLDLFLISPGGQVLELTSDNGGTGNNYTNTCFAPSAATTINFPGPQAPASATPFTGQFRPEGSWSELWDTQNRPINGAWRLQLTDDFAGETGILRDWSITFAPTYEVAYQWTPNIAINCLTCPAVQVNPATPTTYVVTAIDNYGCTVSEDASVNITPLVTTVGVTDPIACFGGNDGSAAVSVNVGGSNTYQWSDPAAQTTVSAQNLASGTYTVTVTNTSGCSATSSVTLTQPTILDLSVTTQDALCFGQASGTAAAIANGGTLPYQYGWSNGQTGVNITNVAVGNYTLTVTDANGCTDQSTITIDQPSAVQISVASLEPVSCFNGSNGQLEVAYAGGTAPFTFQWNNGQSGATATGLMAGDYSVTISDVNGCSNTLQQTLTEPTAINAFATSIAAKCFSANNGELHLDVNGGTPTYAALWSGPNGFGGSGADLTGLLAGAYSATITDQNGCTRSITTQVDEPADLLLALPAISDTICFAASNGSATVVPSGGIAPFTFLWNLGGQTTATATGLNAQQYQVTVTDANGCTETAATRVPQKEQLNTFAQPTLPNCHDGADGTATVLAIYYGVTPANTNAFQYLWNTSPIQTTRTAQLLAANQTYSVTVTDVDGCTAHYSFAMGNPTPVEAEITQVNDVTCHGDTNGWASANATGGTAPYTWLWEAGTTPANSTGEGFAPGLYHVTIMDAHGCPDVAAITIREPDPIMAQTYSTNITCYGEHTGSARASASGGFSPYQYQWWNGEQTNEIVQMEAGVFQLTITDANGCSTQSNVEITQPTAPLTSLVEMVEPRCFGERNGRIIFNPAGGTPPYRYALDDNPFNGSSIQFGLAAGMYDPKIIDSYGCITELPPVEVTQKEKMQVDLGPDISILLGQDTQLIAQVFNFTSNYTLVWSPIDSTWLSCLDCGNPSVYSLEYNRYFEVIAIDSLGCRAQDQVLVSVEKPRKVFVPTAFSPNGDFINDLLLVHGQKASKALVFRIYDRWGEMVYEAANFPFNDPNIGWDGTFRGQPMDPGVYVWVLEVMYEDGYTQLYKGNTTLIR